MRRIASITELQCTSSCALYVRGIFFNRRAIVAPALHFTSLQLLSTTLPLPHSLDLPQQEGDEWYGYREEERRVHGILVFDREVDHGRHGWIEEGAFGKVDGVFRSEEGCSEVGCR